jgi:hypothetical protein
MAQGRYFSYPALPLGLVVQGHGPVYTCIIKMPKLYVALNVLFSTFSYLIQEKIVRY